MKYSYIVDEYTNKMLEGLKLLRPDLSEAEILEVINNEIQKDFINPKVKIHNNFKNITAGDRGDWDLNRFFIWYKQKNPITTEHGVMYQRHDQLTNHMGEMLSMFLSERKVNKKKMLQAKNAGNKQEAELYDVFQKVWKILANSFYGALGQSSCIFYNLYVAASVTGKGQSVISTAMTTFENFLTGSLKYKSLNDLMDFVVNVKNQEKKSCIIKMRDVSDDELKAKLRNDCIESITISDEYLNNILSQCTQEEKNLLYYKNNFKGYLVEKNILDIVSTVVNCQDLFRSGDAVPDSLKDVMNNFWESTEYYVFYNYIKFDKINILKHEERETVLGVDTDSNFIALYNHYSLLQEHLLFDKEDEEITFKIVSMIAFLLSKVIKEAYETYTKNCNVIEEKRPIIAMKNEYIHYIMLM